MSAWAIFAAACLAVTFLPLLILGLGAVRAASDADAAAGRDDAMGEART